MRPVRLQEKPLRFLRGAGVLPGENARHSREETAMRDLIIRGGTIVDGTGEAPFVGDVAIDGDRIVAVGKDLGRRGARSTRAA